MGQLRAFDHLGITVADLDAATAFFVGVDGLRAAVDQLAADGYGLVGGVGQYENAWLMAYIRGPEGITVALAERLG